METNYNYLDDQGNEVTDVYDENGHLISHTVVSRNSTVGIVGGVVSDCTVNVERR